MLQHLPAAIFTHLALFLSSYPTTDVGCLLSMSHSTRSEWNCDLLFLALKYQLLSRKHFHGGKKNTSVPAQHSRRRSPPKRSSKRLKKYGPDLLKNAIETLRSNNERAHDDLYVLGPRAGKLSFREFQKILNKRYIC